MAADSRPLVVYIDDEEINRRVFEANFKSTFNVITFADGPTAIKAISESPMSVAAVLTDQRMPGMTGVELLEQIRGVAPEARRMIISAYSDSEAMVDAVNRGQVSRYFVKPWNKAAFRDAIDDALRIFSLESRLRDLTQRMTQSAQLATVGQVSASIAHELLNPVAYVAQNIESLGRDFPMVAEAAERGLAAKDDAAVREILSDFPNLMKDLVSGIEMVRKIALGIRAQARGDDGESEADLRDVASMVAKLAHGEVRAHARLSIDGPPLRVKASPVGLTQVLLNLVVNAAHAIGETGDKGLIELSWSVEDDTVRVKVSDNGAGIPEEVQSKIFQPLFTTKPPGKGTGLGLGICQEMLLGMGSDLKFTSARGAGTTFYFSLTQAPPRDSVDGK